MSSFIKPQSRESLTFVLKQRSTELWCFHILRFSQPRIIVYLLEITSLQTVMHILLRHFVPPDSMSLRTSENRTRKKTESESERKEIARARFWEGCRRSLYVAFDTPREAKCNPIHIFFFFRAPKIRPQKAADLLKPDRIAWVRGKSSSSPSPNRVLPRSSVASLFGFRERAKPSPDIDRCF